ncbi:hypothetical protein [Paraburkholderia bryophila]|uniref:hypothetical protein n=1 Tax=Paraburkholderia bryophila TaxID=420952 RepID=UPI00142E564E|nr:hypothetical protein [Paraburkholderia bryophila]
MTGYSRGRDSLGERVGRPKRKQPAKARDTLKHYSERHARDQVNLTRVHAENGQQPGDRISFRCSALGFRAIKRQISSRYFGRLGVEGCEPCSKGRAFDPYSATPLAALAFNHSGQSCHDAGAVAGDRGQIATVLGDLWDGCRANLAGMSLCRDKKTRVPVAGCHHAAHPQYCAERTDTPAVRAAQARQKVGGDDQQDTNADQQHAFRDEPATLPAGEDR